jgi:hypothetical protein
MGVAGAKEAGGAAAAAAGEEAGGDARPHANEIAGRAESAAIQAVLRKCLREKGMLGSSRTGSGR